MRLFSAVFDVPGINIKDSSLYHISAMLCELLLSQDTAVCTNVLRLMCKMLSLFEAQERSAVIEAVRSMALDLGIKELLEQMRSATESEELDCLCRVFVEQLDLI